LGHQEGALLRGTPDRSLRDDLANPFAYQFFELYVGVWD
jgi:hypothetical protein